jgi:hypothetical protein
LNLDRPARNLDDRPDLAGEHTTAFNQKPNETKTIANPQDKERWK